MRAPPLTKSRLDAALADLAARDADLARALAAVGPPVLRRRRAGFASLFRAIVAQQLSRASADAIWRRLENAMVLRPDRLLAADPAVLAEAGLSRRKIDYARDLAERVRTGRLDLNGLRRMEDDAVVAELTKVKGIGRWTAEIYLLFSLGRADTWPADDLALMIAAARVKGLPARPDRALMTEIAEPWRPWRGAAAHLLWHYYRHAPA